MDSQSTSQGFLRSGIGSKLKLFQRAQSPSPRACPTQFWNPLRIPLRAYIIFLLLVTVGLAHWFVPVDMQIFHAVHVVMRKAFILPIVLAAIWYQMGGALITTLIASVIYLPHVWLQWAGYTSENMSQIGDVAVLWAVGMIAGWLVGRERYALQEVASMHKGSVHALVAALDAREHDTELHSLRVQAYSRQIAEEMALPDSDLAILETGALLHDVGKIGVPDHIMLKPGPLDTAEWESMRRHPEIGRNILQSARIHPRALEVVRFHHERFDGNGYPCGLRGHEIPLLVRIFAIADAFDAMTSTRPYKEALSIRHARNLIEESSGSHFDPLAVEAFMRISEERWEGISKQLSSE